MRLRSLELKGFKSFANETVINFNSDVTGVVGPNGSGKSNVVDAIRWVLGEQKSSQLRLDKMSSIIFNGTKKRKEAQTASVSLTFDNDRGVLPTEYSTVTITRILYRSGESEYRLNGVTCRLKDITSLFVDTGIGSDSYAIIALGMVDDLLSDRDKARRTMFEQAAGVSKYKKRKQETKSKLDATNADLERVSDLLFEIVDQLKKLEKQAERTRKYYEFKEEYKVQSIELAKLNLARFKDKYQGLGEKIQKEEEKYREMEAKAKAFEAEGEEQRKTHTDKEQGLSEQQRTVGSLTAKVRGMENEKAMLKQKLSFIQNDSIKLQDTISLAKEQVEKLQLEMDGSQTTMNAEVRLERELEDKLDEAQKKLDKVRQEHSLMKGSLEDFVKAQQAIEREITEFEKKRAVQSNQVENLQREIERTQADIARQRGEMTLLENELKKVKEEADFFTKKIAKLEADEESRRKEVAFLEKQTEDLAKKAGEHSRILDAKLNEFKLTKSMVESLEGFPESIKFLSTQKEWSKNAPLLSDLIYVEEGFRVAVENYLEPYLNYYVVADTETAMQAIHILGKSQKGRANFFMLDAIQGYEAPLAMVPGARKATELVTVDPQYRALVDYLLGNVLIGDEAEANTDFIKDNPNFVFLSKSGAYIRRKFSLTGGSVGLFEGKKIGRKKNLELLEKEIKKLEKTDSDLRGQLAALREQLQLRRKEDGSQVIRQEKNAYNAIAQKQSGLQSRYDNIGTFVKNFDEKTSENQRKIEEVEKSNTEIQKLLTEKQKEAENLKKKLDNADGSFRDVAEQLSTASQAYNQQNIEFIRQQNKVNAFRQEMTFRKNRFEELQIRSSTDAVAMARNAEEAAFVEGEIERFEKELQVNYAKKKELEAELSASEQVYFKARNLINELENKLRENFRLQQDVQININRLKDKYSEVKFEITAISERLRAEFGMSVDDIINDAINESLDINELDKAVKNLKRRLDTYGEINPMAIEAYNEIKERHDTIDTQKKDIETAQETLLETMREIEETATERFLESFGQVRNNFQMVFQTLFSEGDTADLILTNADDPLESDIQIIARPKGKKPQTIAQLSGGEKTLTATALLFSLYLLKPAPFCIFDEVDAPLDDANIEKFNKIIRRFSKESQFIIVTHNKATMAAVDVIYGVYMPEQGVSSVAPVDFRKLEHEEMVFEAS